MNSAAFGIYYLGFPILMIIGNPKANLTLLIIGWVLFLGGSILNTVSELLRKPFKDNPANKGKLYTGGLFKHAIHINYLGDCIWVLGLALISNNMYSLLIPLGLIFVFIFGYIPKSDDYLQNKYGEQFTAYKKKTKKINSVYLVNLSPYKILLQRRKAFRLIILWMLHHLKTYRY